MNKNENNISGKLKYWRSQGTNRGFVRTTDAPQKDEGKWRSMGFVPVLAKEKGLQWAFPDELYDPEDAFKRFGNEIEPLMTIYKQASESVINALARYVSNTDGQKIKLGFELYLYNGERLALYHFTSIYIKHYVCYIDYEEIFGYTEDEELGEEENHSDEIDEVPMNVLYEIISFITKKNEQ